MLKFPTTIKNSLKIIFAAFLCFGVFTPAASALANTRTLEHFYNRTAQTQQSNDGYAYRAVARLLSPDGKTELSTKEYKVTLSDGQRVTLKGRAVTVTLEAIENQFKKTNMIRITAGADQSKMSAGAFRLAAFREHSFLYTDKKSGWSIEVRLQPLHPLKALEPYLKHGRPKAPVKNMRKKLKRLPA